jgi:BMFP domain-containing protein YqiC
MTNSGIASPVMMAGGSAPGLAARRCYVACRVLRADDRFAIVGANGAGRRDMTQTSNRFFDEMARLMNDAAGVAQGVRREFDTLFRAQIERILREFNVVQREEFEAVKEMARLAREENEALKSRIEALEGKPAGKPAGKAAKKGKGAAESD